MTTYLGLCATLDKFPLVMVWLTSLFKGIFCWDVIIERFISNEWEFEENSKHLFNWLRLIFRSLSLGSYLTPHLVLVYEEYVGLLIKPPCLRALEECSALYFIYFQLIIIHVWHHRHSRIPLSRFPPRFKPRPQKIRGTHSIPASEKKSAEERATRRQNKQISKHFYIKTSNVPSDETTCRSLF